MRDIYLIDFENVASEGLSGITYLAPEDEVIIFYSNNSNRLSMKMHILIGKSVCKLDYFEASVGGKNALDHQISTWLGYLIGTGAAERNYYIVSRDMGYKFVASFWADSELKPNVRCVESIRAAGRLERSRQAKEARDAQEKEQRQKPEGTVLRLASAQVQQEAPEPTEPEAVSQPSGTPEQGQKTVSARETAVEAAPAPQEESAHAGIVRTEPAYPGETKPEAAREEQAESEQVYTGQTKPVPERSGGTETSRGRTYRGRRYHHNHKAGAPVSSEMEEAQKQQQNAVSEQREGKPQTVGVESDVERKPQFDGVELKPAEKPQPVRSEPKPSEKTQVDTAKSEQKSEEKEKPAAKPRRSQQRSSARTKQKLEQEPRRVELEALLAPYPGLQEQHLQQLIADNKRQILCNTLRKQLGQEKGLALYNEIKKSAWR